MTQAAVPKRRETPRDRPGRAGVRLCSKWLGAVPLRCAVPKLNQWGRPDGLRRYGLLTLGCLPGELRGGFLFAPVPGPDVGPLESTGVEGG